MTFEQLSPASQSCVRLIDRKYLTIDRIVNQDVKAEVEAYYASK
jgi:hypothetical protein